MTASLSASIVGLTLLVAGVAKITDRAAFRETLMTMRVLPRPAVPATSVVLPLIEILLAGMLLLGVAVRVAAATAALLFLIFTAMIANVLMRHQRVPCACFGSGSREPLRRTALARNAALFACSLIAVDMAPSPAARLPGVLCAASLLISGALVSTYVRATAVVRRLAAP